MRAGPASRWLAVLAVLATALAGCSGEEPEPPPVAEARIKGYRTGMLITVKEDKKPLQVSVQDGESSVIWNFVCAPLPGKRGGTINPCSDVTADDIGRVVRIDYQMHHETDRQGEVTKFKFLE